MTAKPIRISFKGSHGTDLAARLDLPLGQIRGFALFAHCFTCSKDIFAAKSIAAELAKEGIGVMRFDFTGLGHSDGEFANTNFSSNLEDLKLAAHFLNDTYGGPDILIGHSLGGAAVLGAAADLPFVKAVVTIGAPAEPEHVVHNFGADLDRIEQDGIAEVKLAGRPFTIKKQFIDDVRSTVLADKIAKLRKPLLVLHSPIDATVGVENASGISRMNKPRSGSLAKLCTEVKTPERTRKVPSRLSEKVTIASNKVQTCRLFRFSITIAECRSAVPVSQGSNDAFSTGSQNQNPPQPSS